jgi:hypothetical protein
MVCADVEDVICCVYDRVQLFYKYEPVPYWMDQRMAPMAYPDYVHSGHVKQVMTRGPEVQQFHLPYTRPELAVRDDIYTDAGSGATARTTHICTP